jgi:hypothetical protein
MRTSRLGKTSRHERGVFQFRFVSSGYLAANIATVDRTLNPSSYAFLSCAALPTFTLSRFADKE